MPIYTALFLMNTIINTQKNFQKIHLYTVFIQGISTTVIDQIPTCLSPAPKNTFCAGIKLFNSLPCSLTILKTDKAKFKAALALYSVDELFMCKDDI